MLLEGLLIKVNGKFIVSKVGEEFVELDPYLQGGIPATDQFEKKGYTEVTENGEIKSFDGFAVGDFFALDGRFEVVRSNNVFCKIMVGDQMVSIPLSKVVI